LNIFISYRREDAQWPARQLHQTIRGTLSTGEVFIDTDSIPAGVDFAAYIQAKIKQSDIVLAIIGSKWLTAVDSETGSRRLDDPNDFVRIELATSLALGKRVVPLIIDNAKFPAQDELPPDLKKLAAMNGEYLQIRTFDADVDRLLLKLGVAKSKSVSNETKPVSTAKKWPKSKWIAFWLALVPYTAFFGAHKFYLELNFGTSHSGLRRVGLLYLLFFLLAFSGGFYGMATDGPTAFLAYPALALYGCSLIEAAIYALKTREEFHEDYVIKRRRFF